MQLFAADFAAVSDTGKVPVLCLPGLTRNSRDFEPALAQLTARRRVICMDFRGRGKSAHAIDPLTYRVDVETLDVVALLEHLALARVAVIGTSRGGLVGMGLAATVPARIAGLLLNDIGPVLEVEGLLRIRKYIGLEPNFASFHQAAMALKRDNSGMEGLSDNDWLAFAHRIFRNDNGVPRLAYDARLALTFPTEEQIRASAGTELWPLFQKLDGLPLAVLHGANSDLLSAATVREMKARMPQLTAATVPGRAHVPFLDEPGSVATIEHWLSEVDAAQD